jgi:hypothetical protein
MDTNNIDDLFEGHDTKVVGVDRSKNIKSRIEFLRKELGNDFDYCISQKYLCASDESLNPWRKKMFNSKRGQYGERLLDIFRENYRDTMKYCMKYIDRKKPIYYNPIEDMFE